MLSDLYAMGVTDCDNMLMLLGVSTKLTEKERDVVIPLMMRGFKVSTGTEGVRRRLVKTMYCYHVTELGISMTNRPVDNATI